MNPIVLEVSFFTYILRECDKTSKGTQDFPESPCRIIKNLIRKRIVFMFNKVNTIKKEN